MITKLFHCQERDIDAEIASRGQSVKTEFSCATISSLGHSASLGSSLGSIAESVQPVPSRIEQSCQNEAPYNDADALRRKRQQVTLLIHFCLFPKIFDLKV